MTRRTQLDYQRAFSREIPEDELPVVWWANPNTFQLTQFAFWAIYRRVHHWSFKLDPATVTSAVLVKLSRHLETPFHIHKNTLFLFDEDDYTLLLLTGGDISCLYGGEKL